MTSLCLAGWASQLQAQSSLTRRNVIIFVADGLREGSVTAQTAPTMIRIRNNGVFFSNSHSLFPTFTTANASAIATGHQLGDTGDFSNTIFSGYPVYDTGNFGQPPGTVTPFIENNLILSDLNDHFRGNYLDEVALMAIARLQGYNTASIGKVGPVAIQDVTQIAPVNKVIPTPNTVLLMMELAQLRASPFQAKSSQRSLRSLFLCRPRLGLTGAPVQPNVTTATPATTQPSARHRPMGRSSNTLLTP